MQSSKSNNYICGICGACELNFCLECDEKPCSDHYASPKQIIEDLRKEIALLNEKEITQKIFYTLRDLNEKLEHFVENH